MNTDDDIDDDFIPQLSPTFRFQWEEAQDCYVVLYPEGMVKLSHSAGAIMKHCDGEQNVATIITALQQEFPGAELGPDVLQFLTHAREHGWIRQKPE